MQYFNTREDMYESLASRSSDVAEIGVWKGGNAEAILKRANPRRLILVDRWLKVDDPTNRPSMDRPAEVVEREYLEVCERFLADRRVLVWRMPSITAALYVPKESLDWVYIDACHEFKSFCLDLTTWAQRVRPDGYVCGHDFESQFHPGVQRGVELAIESGMFELVGKTMMDQKSFMLRKVAA